MSLMNLYGRDYYQFEKDGLAIPGTIIKVDDETFLLLHPVDCLHQRVVIRLAGGDNQQDEGAEMTVYVLIRMDSEETPSQLIRDITEDLGWSTSSQIRAIAHDGSDSLTDDLEQYFVNTFPEEQK